MADITGTSRRLLSETATVTDTYSLDAFGRQMSASGTTVNPYRFGAAWGYITDTAGSGLLQLGARFYWPEVGRFVQSCRRQISLWLTGPGWRWDKLVCVCREQPGGVG
jgi:hypothetical protein